MSTRLISSVIAINLILIIMLPAMTWAATLAWDANTDPVDGYKVHYGTSQNELFQTIDVKKATSYNLDQLSLSENVRYYFSVSAYNAVGDSPLAPAVSYDPPVTTLPDTTPPNPPEVISLEELQPID